MWACAWVSQLGAQEITGTKPEGGWVGGGGIGEGSDGKKQGAGLGTAPASLMPACPATPVPPSS